MATKSFDNIKSTPKQFSKKKISNDDATIPSLLQSFNNQQTKSLNQENLLPSLLILSPRSDDSSCSSFSPTSSCTSVRSSCSLLSTCATTSTFSSSSSTTTTPLPSPTAVTATLPSPTTTTATTVPLPSILTHSSPVDSAPLIMKHYQQRFSPQFLSNNNSYPYYQHQHHYQSQHQPLTNHSHDNYHGQDWLTHNLPESEYSEATYVSDSGSDRKSSFDSTEHDRESSFDDFDLHEVIHIHLYIYFFLFYILFLNNFFFLSFFLLFRSIYFHFLSLLVEISLQTTLLQCGHSFNYNLPLLNSPSLIDLYQDIFFLIFCFFFILYFPLHYNITC